MKGKNLYLLLLIIIGILFSSKSFAAPISVNALDDPDISYYGYTEKVVGSWSYVCKATVSAGGTATFFGITLNGTISKEWKIYRRPVKTYNIVVAKYYTYHNGELYLYKTEVIDREYMGTTYEYKAVPIT